MDAPQIFTVTAAGVAVIGFIIKQQSDSIKQTIKAELGGTIARIETRQEADAVELVRIVTQVDGIDTRVTDLEAWRRYHDAPPKRAI